MKSNFKRAIASISTIALAASTFAGFTITANAAETKVPFAAQTRIDSIENGVITAAGNAGNEHGLALADLSGIAGIYDAGEVSIEFDSTIRSGSRWVIGIGDKAVRGTNASESLKNNYNTTNGLSAFFGTSNGSSYVLNGTTTIGNALGANVHAEYVLDNVNKKYTLTLSAPSGERTVSGSASKADLVEVYTWNNNDSITISDVTVTTLGSANPGPTVNPIGKSDTVPYRYSVGNIDYGIGGTQSFNGAGSTNWSADAANNTVKFTKNNAAVHYTDIANENNLGYPVNKIVIPIVDGFDKKDVDTVLYVLKDAPAVSAMENAESGAFAREATTNVKSFINVENQIFKHAEALADVDSPDVLSEDSVLAKIVIKNDRNAEGKYVNWRYSVIRGRHAKYVKNKSDVPFSVKYKDTEGKEYTAIVLDIATELDAAGIERSCYQANDLMIYTATALGTFGPLAVDFKIPAETYSIDAIDQNAIIKTSDYYSDHNEGIYYIGRANTNGLNSIDVTGNGGNAETIVKIFALTNTLAGEDEKKDFLHDYTHQETKPETGVYKNVKYYQLGGDAVIPAGSTQPVQIKKINDPEPGPKFIYAVVMKKVPTPTNDPTITETDSSDTSDIAQITYNYKAKRYANAIRAEWLLLNTDVADVAVDDNNYELINNYAQYQQALQNRVDEIQQLSQAGKTENVFTETYAAKWAKIRDEKEAMEVIVKAIYDEITSNPVVYTRDPSSEYIRNKVNEIWMSYTRASIAGKSYVKENNFDELKKAYDDLMAFYDSVIDDYTKNIAKIYDIDTNAVKITTDNYLGEEGWVLNHLNDLITSGQYAYDKAKIAKKVTEAIDPEKGGINVEKIVNDLNNVVSTYYNTTRDKFGELYQDFYTKYEAANRAGDIEGKKKAIDEATELSDLVDAIESSAYRAEIRDAIDKDYRYSWKNPIDNFKRFRAESVVVDAARDFIAKTAESKAQIDSDQIGGISSTSFDAIAEKYWEATVAAQVLDYVCGQIPEANAILAEFGLVDAIADAKKNLNESWLYVQRAAEIVGVPASSNLIACTTADLMAALDDIANDADIEVKPENQKEIAEYFTKVKLARAMYDALVTTHKYTKDGVDYYPLATFLSGKSNDYFPFAQAYQAPADTIIRSKNAAPINYTAMLAAAEAKAEGYRDKAVEELENLYYSNIDALEDYIATLSFRDYVFENFRSHYDAMATVYRDIVRYNNINRYYNSTKFIFDAKKDDWLSVDIDLKIDEKDITTERLATYVEQTYDSKTKTSKYISLVPGESNDDFLDFQTKFKNYETFIDTITWDVVYSDYINKTKKHANDLAESTALYEEDQDLFKAIEDMINELSNGGDPNLVPGTLLKAFAQDQPQVHELIEAVEDYIKTAEPNPSKKVEYLLTKIIGDGSADGTYYDTDLKKRVKAAIPAHKDAVEEYGKAYVNIGGHSVTDYTTGDNSAAQPGANNSPDYNYDLDPLRYDHVYFTKRDVDAWELRLRPAIETALDARSGYDAASIADSMLMIPDAEITPENYHEFDATIIPAHELFAGARTATQNKIKNNYPEAYNYYKEKWDQYVAANDEVAKKINELTAKAEEEINGENGIVPGIQALYDKVTDPATVYETVEEVQDDINAIEELIDRINAGLKDENGDYTYLNRNYFKHQFVLEDYESQIWTIESILDDWYKSVPVIIRARYAYDNLDIVDDLDATNVKVGYKVVVDDKDAGEEIDEILGEFNTIRDHGGTMFDRTAYGLLNKAVNDAMTKYRTYKYATDNFGTPAYKVPTNLNFYDVDNNDQWLAEVKRLYDFYRQIDADSFFDSEVRKTTQAFFMDEIEKVNRLYDVLYIDRPAGTYFGEMSDYEAALEFNEDLQKWQNGTSTMSDDEFYHKYLELLANHPKAVPFLDPALYAVYVEIVGTRDETGLDNFTKKVKALDYGSYANPWGRYLVYKSGSKTPDDIKSEEEYQKAYAKAVEAYDELSSNAKDAIADPEANNRIQQDASKAFKLLTESIPVWHEDFVKGYKDAAIASGYAAVANNYKGNITEANYKDALAAYNNAVDARATLDKYPAHNLYQAEVTVTTPFGTNVVTINPNFDDLTWYVSYADQYESDITEALTSTLKSAIGEQLANVAAVIATEDLINKIGTVTVDSGEAIAAARVAYELLAPTYQGMVKNYSVLLAAENAYAALDDVKNAKAYAGPAIEAIDAIGTVTRQSGDAIKDARAKYDALSDLSKTFVSNYDVLTKAEADYAKLEKASGDVTGDGKIGIADVNMVLQAILGNAVLTDAQKVAADVNQDGKINVLDLVAMVALW